MSIPQSQIDELKHVFKSLGIANEGGTPYFLIPAIALPAHCTPNVVDGLLCPLEQNGYPSRMYYSPRIERPPHPIPEKRLSWQAGTIRVLERNWNVLSWRIPNGTSMRLLQMVLAHLDAFQ
jgi:hypothetical protein